MDAALPLKPTGGGVLGGGGNDLPNDDCCGNAPRAGNTRTATGGCWGDEFTVCGGDCPEACRDSGGECGTTVTTASCDSLRLQGLSLPLEPPVLPRPGAAAAAPVLPPPLLQRLNGTGGGADDASVPELSARTVTASSPPPIQPLLPSTTPPKTPLPTPTQSPAPAPLSHASGSDVPPLQDGDRAVPRAPFGS